MQGISWRYFTRFGFDDGFWAWALGDMAARLLSLIGLHLCRFIGHLKSVGCIALRRKQSAGMKKKANQFTTKDHETTT